MRLRKIPHAIRCAIRPEAATKPGATRVTILYPGALAGDQFYTYQTVHSLPRVLAMLDPFQWHQPSRWSTRPFV